MGKGLSYLQVDILTHLLEVYDWVDQHGNDFAKREVYHWGVRWYPSKIWDWSDWPDGYSRSVAAAVSRAVVRLEKRGLVLRNNNKSGGTPDPQPALDFWTRKPIMATGMSRISADQTPPARCVNLKLTEAGREAARSLVING